MSDVRRRKKAQTKSDKNTGFLNEDGNPSRVTAADDATPVTHTTESVRRRSYKRFFKTFYFCFGLVCISAICKKYSWYLETLHENDLWFSNIKELEREISFRTEQGLYYSYYKQLVQAETVTKGIQDLMQDKSTESGRTINILARFNIYQEIVLSYLYRTFISDISPIFFYTKAVFLLNGFGLAMLSISGWFITDSILLGILTAVFYVLNKQDATRVYFTISLRESFALPFLYMQTFFILNFLRSKSTYKPLLTVCTFLSTFIFACSWQFAQFVLLLQAITLHILTMLKLVKFQTNAKLQTISLISLMCVIVLQNNQTMLSGSVVMSFIPISITFLNVKDQWASFIGKKTALFLHIIIVPVATFVANSVIKWILKVDSDEHIFKFLKAKLLYKQINDLETSLYLCNSGFNTIDVETYWRLTENFVFPLYVIQVILVAIAGLCYIFRKKENVKLESTIQTVKNLWSQWMTERSDVVYLIIFSLFLGIMAAMTLRMKFIWVPFICILGPLTVSKAGLWGRLRQSSSFVTVLSILCHLVLLTITGYKLMQVFSHEITDLKEFWDPDTVELMEWITEKTSPSAAFAGSMQLLAGVKLCTGRPITNHPHFEDKWLRQRTEQIYQMYAHRSPKDVHQILHEAGASYIILEDSLCLSPPRNGCSLPEIMNMHNAQIYPTIDQTSIPLFCDAVRHMRLPYSTYFKLVFRNKTFRVYRLLYNIETQSIQPIPSFNM